MITDIGIGDVVRHFKGKYYKIIGFGQHTETGEEEVIYQALYPPFGTWVRPKAMFMSEVDHEKYPNVKQKYRFEVMTVGELNRLASEKRLIEQDVIPCHASFDDDWGERIYFGEKRGIKIKEEIFPVS